MAFTAGIGFNTAGKLVAIDSSGNDKWRATQQLENAIASTTNTAGQTMFTTNYASSGGVLHITGVFSAYTTATGLKTFNLLVDGVVVQPISFFFNVTSVHTMLTFDAIVTGLASGSRTISMNNPGGSVFTDTNDSVTMSIIELPFQ